MKNLMKLEDDELGVYDRTIDSHFKGNAGVIKDFLQEHNQKFGNTTVISFDVTNGYFYIDKKEE